MSLSKTFIALALVRWKKLIFGSILLSLNACTGNQESFEAQTAKLKEPYSYSPSGYLELASQERGEEREELLLQAAGRALYDGNWQEASEILTQTFALSPRQKEEKLILLADIDLIYADPQAALAKLAKVKQSEELPIYFRAKYHGLLAKAYALRGNLIYSVRERLKLQAMLGDKVSYANNQKALWMTLNRMPRAEVETLSLETKEGSELQGWLKLTLIHRAYRHDRPKLESELLAWKQAYPRHSAQTIMTQIFPQFDFNGLKQGRQWVNWRNQPLNSKTSQTQEAFNQGKTSRLGREKIALLLPVTGKLAGPGSAIRDGFMAAYAAKQGHLKVQLYDTGSNDAAKLYQKALDEGADYVLGPLTKTEVAKVANLAHPVPTLMLNESGLSHDDKVYQFALSPTNEAKAVAAKAHRAGLNRALIIAPQGSWGDDIVGAFTKEWEADGGLIVDRLRFSEGLDLNKGVRNLLRVSEKVAYGKQFKPSAKMPVEPLKRRGDFDLIFLLAYPSKARQIMPLLKYYFAGNVPVYATSAVYSGSPNPMQDKDLEGLIFCDMPWMFGSKLAHKNWPEQLNSYNRLYALGRDSYDLVLQLNHSAATKLEKMAFYLNENQQIIGELAWGRFSQGLAKKIA